MQPLNEMREHLSALERSDRGGLMLGWENGLTVAIDQIEGVDGKYRRVTGVRFGTVVDEYHEDIPYTPIIRNGHGEAASWRPRAYFLDLGIAQARRAIEIIEEWQAS